MEIKSLSGKDICAIIESCAKTNMRELQIGDMHMKFGPRDQGEMISPVGTLASSIPTEVDAQNNTERDEGFITSMQSRAEEDVIQTQKLLDDPMGFEEEIMNSFVYRDGSNENQ